MHAIADRCAELSGSQALLRAVIEGIPDPLFVKDRRGQFVLINSAAARFVGRLEEEILGRRDADLFEPDATRRMGEIDVRVLSSYQTETAEWSRAESNVTRTYLSTNSIYRDHQGEVLGLIHLVIDLTDRKRIEQRLEYQALHDSLTDLPNRVQIQTLLERGLMPDPSGHIAPAALLLIDLDRFKEINDTFGHHYGDAVLQQIGHRLRASLRRSDMVARLGGDEFGILLPGGDEVAAVQVAENVLDCSRQPIVVEGTCSTSAPASASPFGRSTAWRAARS
ncbi:MAG: GGDEF domain-containing protein [Singulisphaera sp.]